MQTDTSRPALANEFNRRFPDFTLLDGFDEAYLAEVVEDVEGMTVEARQALNLFMADYFNG